MNAKELRDKLIEKRTLYRNAVAECETACIEIKKIFSSFDDQTINLLENKGFSISPILYVNLDELKKNPQMLEDYSKKLSVITRDLNKYLEEELNA